MNPRYMRKAQTQRERERERERGEMADTTRGVGPSSPSIERPTVFIPDAWAEKADAIAYHCETSPPPVTLICGAKNTGKSTFSRHLLNTLLTRRQDSYSSPLERGYLSHPIKRRFGASTGYDMLVEMLRYFVPTHVVKIRITVDSKNLPPGAFWLDENEEVQVNVIDIDAARQDSSNRSVLVRKDARLMRDLRLIAYIRQCFPSDMNIMTYKELAHALASLPPYQVPISAVKVMHLHCKVPNNENFHSLNATIVGLAMNYGKSADSEPCVPWCFGLGIVRSIDVSNGLLYIITPVPHCNLEKVDLLLQGFIEIPTCLLQVSGCLSPYMSTNVMHRIEAPDMNAQPRCQSHAE
ncbi:Polynucleotide 5'-hydroxyl-kinase NOL9 [Acorus gramineus]|uniref:Polynucleotide 5'-hydroxyl-kinase NOL9 n=1 Tax=Acorus gramineus TaxID=55184 RepID=A0AAV9AJ42_ACOGR|nr:Polynucleotide 5'-hydroxyl-kinase NOL9 [Acorus gramineus]